MAWFRRGSRDSGTAEAGSADAAGSSALVSTDSGTGDLPLEPVLEKVPAAEQDRIAAAVDELANAGVDVDDLVSLGAGLDAAFGAWQSADEGAREPHERIVERFALGIGEHLHRHTDLRWQVVTDAFGTDLGVAGGPRGGFVVVPTNLVAVRWLRREQGWVPAVVGHIVRRRNER